MKMLTDEEIYNLRLENEKSLILGKFIMCVKQLHRQSGELKEESLIGIKMSTIVAVEKIATYEEEGWEASYIYTTGYRKYFTHLFFQSVIELVNLEKI